MRVTDIVLQCEVTRGMQLGIDIGSESDGYRFTVGVSRGMQVDIDIRYASDGYRFTMGGCSGDADRC